ncbi:MAG: response regulator [Nitrospiraceae bacterium]|nr:response regulator [Nitrospiraceae bacterium]
MPDEFTAGAGASVLLVERDGTAGGRIRMYLVERGYAVEWVDDGEKAINLLDSHSFDGLVTELNAPRVEGMRLMAVARGRNREVCAVVIAEHSDIELATEAMRQGAYDFQTKPVNLAKLDAVLQRGLDHQRLVRKQHELRRRLDEHYGLGNLVGNSRPMVRVYDAVRQAAHVGTPVLIAGESGTGKDLVAQAIHNNSRRRDEAFVKVQCGGLPESRVTADLFGCVAGALPGTPQAQPGRIELADGGTLFLDDVGALTPSQQAAALELLLHQRFQRIGGKRNIRVDVRVIAAAGRPLAAGAFNAELLSALSAIAIETPPLRERREDIAPLVQYFLREASRESGLPMTSITRNGLDLLTRYEWPGNVRELRNVVEGMALTVRGQRPLGVNDVPAYLRQDTRSEDAEIRIPVGAPMHMVERAVIEETIKATGYNRERCAERLGIGVRTLYRKLKEYGIG